MQWQTNADRKATGLEPDLHTLKAFIYKDFKEKEKNYPKSSDSSRLVRTKGFEPTRNYPQEPETCASASFATSAHFEKRLYARDFRFFQFSVLTF